MFTSVVVCFPLVAVCLATSVLTRQQIDRQAEQQSNYNDYPGRGRTKRGIPTFIGALLKTANLRYSSRNYRIYEKKGGYYQALMDFIRLRPHEIEDFGISKWGTVGDKTVFVRDEGSKAVLNIWKHERNKDGVLELIADRIEYTD